MFNFDKAKIAVLVKACCWVDNYTRLSDDAKYNLHERVYQLQKFLGYPDFGFVRSWIRPGYHWSDYFRDFLIENQYCSIDKILEEVKLKSEVEELIKEFNDKNSEVTICHEGWDRIYYDKKF